MPTTFLFCKECYLFFISWQKILLLRTRKARTIAVESASSDWTLSYAVSRVTVLLTAQYFKARFVWKCLHSTCTAVGLAVVASIRPSVCLSVGSFSAFICSARGTCLISARLHAFNYSDWLARSLILDLSAGY